MPNAIRFEPITRELRGTGMLNTVPEGGVLFVPVIRDENGSVVSCITPWVGGLEYVKRAQVAVQEYAALHGLTYQDVCPSVRVDGNHEHMISAVRRSVAEHTANLYISDVNAAYAYVAHLHATVQQAIEQDSIYEVALHSTRHQQAADTLSALEWCSPDFMEIPVEQPVRPERANS